MSRTWRYKCRNQLTSPTESALRHECIIHSYAHKGLSVWQDRRFQLDATHNQHQDWKHFGIVQNSNPLVRDLLYPKYHIFNTYTQRRGNKKTPYTFYNICWVLSKDVNTCTQSRYPVVSGTKQCAVGTLESTRRKETAGACWIVNKLRESQVICRYRRFLQVDVTQFSPQLSHLPSCATRWPLLNNRTVLFCTIFNYDPGRSQRRNVSLI